MNTDEIIDSLLEKVGNKKREIKSLERPHWKTNCMFGGGSNKVNIQTVKDIGTLVGFYAECLSFLAAWDESCKNLEVKTKCILHGNYVENWMADIKTRVQQVEIKGKKDELAGYEEKLNSLVSSEKRREIELQKLVEALG